jgi:Asp-tRNA(Asn)/Glu-tRNA(Gln) amidotransferase A subunit family amidase
MTTSLHFLELTELAAHLQRRQLSPVEVARAQLDRLDVGQKDRQLRVGHG